MYTLDTRQGAEVSTAGAGDWTHGSKEGGDNHGRVGGLPIPEPEALDAGKGLSHIVKLSFSFRKSTPPQNRQLIVYYY